MITSKNILTSLAGIGTGVLIGILSAPEKGRKTRKKITRKSNDYIKGLISEIKNLQKNISSKTKKTNDGIKKLSKKEKELQANKAGS